MLDGGIEREGLFLMKKKAVKKVMKKPAKGQEADGEEDREEVN